MLSKNRDWRKQEIHFVSFFTEGPPHDSGPDLSVPAGHLTNSLKERFSSVRVLSPRQLLEEGSDWQETLRDFTTEIESRIASGEEAKWNPGWARMGLFAWKPRLILETLRDYRVAPGDLVFYHDSDVSKYPVYLKGINRWHEWLPKRARGLDALFFIDNRSKLTSDTKPEVWRQFFSEEEASRFKHIWAGALLVRKTPGAMDLIARWNDLCRNPDNLLPFSAAFDSRDFVQHSPDQGLLACLYYDAKNNRDDLRLEAIDLLDSRQIPPSWLTRTTKLISRFRKRLRKAFLH